MNKASIRGSGVQSSYEKVYEYLKRVINDLEGTEDDYGYTPERVSKATVYIDFMNGKREGKVDKGV